jgi:predicted nucleic acid-binding protein
MIVADSDVLIDALRGREPARSRVAEAIRTDGLATTAATRFELLAGARSKGERDKVEALLSPLAILSLGTPEADEAAAVCRELAKKGTPIGMGDSLIAGICRARSLALLTRNRAHFEIVPGLRLAALD